MALQWDPKRNVWRISVRSSAPGAKRTRAVRDVPAAPGRAGRKIAELAEAQLRVEIAAQLEAGWPGGTTTGTFAAAADAWVERNRGRWSPKTTKETVYALKRYILPDLGAIVLHKVTPSQIEAMYSGWSQAGRAASSMRRWHGMVRSIYGDAERLGELAGPNPMVRVRAAGGKAPERRIPTPDEVSQIIAAAANPAVATYFECAVGAGARRGTLVALRWRDVDLDVGELKCVQAVTIGPDGPVLRQTKANRAYAVGIAGPALESLREHRRRAIAQAFEYGETARMEDLFVFSSDGGKTHWDVGWPTHAWAVACKKVGVSYHLHDARHFSATRLLAENVPVRVVADRLGCSEHNVTRTYSHRVVGPEDARAAQILADLRTG